MRISKTNGKINLMELHQTEFNIINSAISLYQLSMNDKRSYILSEIFYKRTVKRLFNTILKFSSEQTQKTTDNENKTGN